MTDEEYATLARLLDEAAQADQRLAMRKTGQACARVTAHEGVAQGRQELLLLAVGKTWDRVAEEGREVDAEGVGDADEVEHVVGHAVPGLSHLDPAPGAAEQLRERLAGDTRTLAPVAHPRADVPRVAHAPCLHGWSEKGNQTESARLPEIVGFPHLQRALSRAQRRMPLVNGPASRPGTGAEEGGARLVVVSRRLSVATVERWTDEG